MSICGLDFGTSNTTLGTIEGHVPVLAALETGQTTIPSAIFYEVDGAVLIGRRRRISIGIDLQGAGPDRSVTSRDRERAQNERGHESMPHCCTLYCYAVAHRAQHLSHIAAPRPRDELRPKPRLFGKFCRAATGRGGLRTLFIKLEFILNERRPRMVNNGCAVARQAVNAVLSR